MNRVIINITVELHTESMTENPHAKSITTVALSYLNKDIEKSFVAMLNPKSSHNYDKYFGEFRLRKIEKYAHPITANKDWRHQLDELDKFNNWWVFCENSCLDLESIKLTSIPSELGNLSSLQVLRLSNNQLQSIPSELGNISSLQVLRLDNNQLQSIPSELGKLQLLQELWLDNNQLQSIPSELGNLLSLQRLLLHNNQLQSIPKELKNISSLVYISFFNKL